MVKNSQQSFPIKKDAPIDRFLTPFHKFYKYEASSGIVLIITVFVALVWANLNSTSYFSLWQSYLTISVASFELSKPLYLWINDLLMAIFFLLVGLEVKRELLIGELRNPKSAMLPIAAALGGIVVPASLYLVFNLSNPLGIRGWAIPAATDIAFALGILYLLGDRVPVAARVFLATLAIIDDIAAILIIALFYTGTINISYLLFAISMFGVLVIFNRLNVRRILPYLVIGGLMWYGFFGSGIHATIAGVFLAFTIPASIKMDFMEFRERTSLLATELISLTNDNTINSEELPIYQNTIAELEHTTQQVQAPLQRLEHSLAPWVIYGIMPIFALANAGVILSQGLVSSLLTPISLGIIFGLFIGKPLGIFLFSYLAIRLQIAELPDDMNLTTIIGIGYLAGIGFTMSTFISTLAFEFEPAILEITKVAILLTSFLSAIVGYIFLHMTSVISVLKVSKDQSELPG